MAELSDLQMDALREMGNIGAGNAATSLSQMVSETINISVPSVKFLPLEEVAKSLGGAEKIVYVIYLEVLRGLHGTMLTVFSPEAALFFSRRLMGQEHVDMDSDLAQSALKEVGSILCGSYLCALSQVVGTNAVASVPAMTCDMLGAILNFILVEIGQIADEVFLIDTELYIGTTRLECSQLFLPRPEALEAILNAIGVA